MKNQPDPDHLLSSQYYFIPLSRGQNEAMNLYFKEDTPE